MTTTNNHFQVSAFAYFMANQWSRETAVSIFGENMGKHFFAKWCAYAKTSTHHASLLLYLEMTDTYREQLISAALDHYDASNPDSWIMRQ